LSKHGRIGATAILYPIDNGRIAHSRREDLELPFDGDPPIAVVHGERLADQLQQSSQRRRQSPVRPSRLSHFENRWDKV